MSAQVISPHHFTHDGRRSFGIALAVAALVLGSTVLVADRMAIDQATTDVTTAPSTDAAPTTTEAIGGWLAATRDEHFPGAQGPYAGTCPTEAPATTFIGLCSSLREDLGDVQLHTVGVWASDWGADLLLVREGDGWIVAGVSPWPQLGTRYDGSPWSPLTAITTWWFDRAPARYGAGAVHLQDCSDATAGIEAGTDQPLLCSTLVDDAGTTRTYDSGLAGQPPDVQLVVERQADRTWSVVDVVER